MDRRQFRHRHRRTGAAVAAGPAFAQDAFPSHAITIINAFPPGGANDIVTRPFAAALEPILKQPVVVETKAGAAGQVGAQVAASAKPDGYTLLSHNNGISGYAEVDKLFGRQPKTTRADFIPLARLVADPVLLLVNDQQPYKTAEGIHRRRQEAARQPIVYSSGGLYGATHLPVALFEKATGMSEAAPPADQRRRAGDHRAARQQRADAARRPCRPRCRISRPANCAPLASFGASVPRLCRTCRRSKSSATMSNIISGSASSRRRARRAESWRR